MSERRTLLHRVKSCVVRVSRPGTRAAGVSILACQRIDDELAQQIDRLRREVRIITLDEAVRGLSREDPAVDNTLVLTFDTDSVDFAERACPVLNELHVPATLYIDTAAIEAGRPARSGPQPMSWVDLATVLDGGLVTIGVRGHSPLAVDDIARSIDLLATHVQQAPLHFAYPDTTRVDASTRDFVDQHFRSAVAGRGRHNAITGSDLHHLVRAVR